MSGLPRNRVLVGDAADRLRQLPTDSIDCVITSPPYFQLRRYGVDGQIGLEGDVGSWVERLREVFIEVARSLKPSGALWLNLGDSFSRHHRYGAPPKSLLLAPERLLLALAGDGWIVRNKVIWAKPNPMPASVGDRFSLSYEVVYLLVRSPRYFFDLDAVRQPHRSAAPHRARSAPEGVPAWAGPLAGKQDGLRRERPAGQPGHRLGKNPGDVWTIGTRGFRGGHFATFPEQLVERPLLTTCPESVCSQCHQPWPRRRLSLSEPGPLAACDCSAVTQPGVVLDPFFGTGTVGVVARRHRRDWIGIELNPAYVEMARRRVGASPYEAKVAA